MVEIPGYASLVVFELYDTSERERFVRLVYNQKTLFDEPFPQFIAYVHLCPHFDAGCWCFLTWADVSRLALFLPWSGRQTAHQPK